MDPDTTEPIDSSNEKLQNLHNSHTKLVGLHHDATARLNKLERRVNKLESDTDSDSDASSEASELNDDYMLGFEENVIHEVRDVDYENFKNRYTERDGKYCIEVLVAGSDLDDQVRRELKRRDLLDLEDMQPGDSYDESEEQITHRVRIQSPSLLFLLHSMLETEQSNGSFLWKGQNRITFFRPFTWFIYAQEKMKLKLEELEQQFSHGPLSTTIAKMQTVAEFVATLEPAAIPDKNTTSTESEQASEIAPVAHNPTKNPETLGTKLKSLPKRVERRVLERALLESYQTLLSLRCYVGFVESRIMPQATKYRSPSSLSTPEPPQVRYQDLAYLFQPGELVYIAALGTEPSTAVAPRIARVVDVYTPDVSVPGYFQSPYNSACFMPKRRPARPTNSLFVLNYYTVDYNGDVYGPIFGRISYNHFSGQIAVNSLQAYPLRFHANKESVLLTAQKEGKKFGEAVHSKHMLYCGWSFRLPPAPPGRSRPTRPPPPPGMQSQGRIGIGPPAPPQVHSYDTHEFVGVPEVPDESRGAAIDKLTYIESDVIVDIKEATRAVPSWGVYFLDFEPTDAGWKSEDWCVLQDSIELIRWTDRHRKTKVSSVQDRIQANDEVSTIESKRASRNDKFKVSSKNPNFTAEDYALLPRRLFAYALRERKFFVGDIESFLRIETGDNPFENLKIDESHVRIVQSVVWSHFQRKSMEALSTFRTQMDQDLIRGKGRGLVILLHGAPGVGKTATAEAVAQWHRKPLFVITCGDLGFTPQGVESSLSEIFRLAHLWGCILLLDEADVFLSQRETNALQRNALVSVFLRVLEYYNGILFLTTNRVGTLDEAFKSRVHLSLYYPALNQSQTIEIMRMNLERLDLIEKERAKSTSKKPLFIRKDEICIFARQHWDRHTNNDGEGRWNGRQIRNAVQIAASLALYDQKTDQAQGADDIPPLLDARHFEVVEKTMTLFEGYISKTRGGSATFIAKQRSERDDHFKIPELPTREQQYGAPPASIHGVGGYMPYPNQPQPPQYSGMPQQYPMTQQYSQHLAPSDPVRVSMAIPAPFTTAGSLGHPAAQAELYKQALQQQMSGGIPPPHSALGHVDQASSYSTAGVPPSSMSFPSQGQFDGGRANR